MLSLQCILSYTILFHSLVSSAVYNGFICLSFFLNFSWLVHCRCIFFLFIHIKTSQTLSHWICCCNIPLLNIISPNFFQFFLYTASWVQFLVLSSSLLGLSLSHSRVYVLNFMSFQMLIFSRLPIWIFPIQMIIYIYFNTDHSFSFPPWVPRSSCCNNT